MSELLTLEEVANELRCSARTIRRRVHEGALPVVVDGGLVRVRRGDLAGYVARRVVLRLSEPESSPAAAAGVRLGARARLWDE